MTRNPLSDSLELVTGVLDKLVQVTPYGRSRLEPIKKSLGYTEVVIFAAVEELNAENLRSAIDPTAPTVLDLTATYSIFLAPNSQTNASIAAQSGSKWEFWRVSLL